MSTYTELWRGFVLGPWQVYPDRNLLRDGDVERHIEPKQMNALVVLASRQGEVVSADDLIEAVWDNRAQTDEVVQRAISQIRRALGDSPREPKFIETIPRRGYRLKIPVEMPDAAETSMDAEGAPGGRGRPWIPLAAGLAGLVVIVLIWRSGTAPDTAIEPTTPMRSVAVFPFECPGNTAEYLCFGFSEELTSTLLQARDLKVVRSRSPFPRGGDDRAVAAALNVDGLLTGSVQQAEDRLKIAAELVDARNGEVLLSDTIEGRVQEIFRLQEQVAAGIARSIQGVNEPVLRAASEPSSFEAFEAYARGQLEFDIRSLASIERAIGLFEETIRLDPLFGPAYLRLAYAYLLLPEYDPSVSRDAMYELATARTDAGIAADPSILEPAGTVFGFIHHKRGEWYRATEAYEMAVSARTVYPISHHWYSRLLASVGRLEDSLEHATRAYELDPDSAVIISRLAIANFWVGNLDAAGRYFEMANHMRLDAPIHFLAYALFLARTEDIDAAKIVSREALARNDLGSGWLDAVMDGIADPTLRPAAVALFDQSAATGEIPEYITLTVWVLLGELDLAMETALALENYGAAFELEVLFIEEFRELRSHERFPELLQRAGLLDYWDRIGCRWAIDQLECD